MEKQLDDRDSINKVLFDDIRKEIAKMAEDAIIRVWVSEEIEKRAEEVITGAKTEHDKL